MSDGKDIIQDAVKGAKKATRSEKRSDAPEVIAFAPENPPKKSAKVEAMKYLPEGCPVVPLGLDGDVYFYMDACRQMRMIKADKHQRLTLQSLFVPQTEFCEANWPRFNKDGDVVGADWDMVARSLMDAAGKIGPIDIDKRVRGPGCWPSGDGQLIMHCGDMVYHGDQGFLPGKIGDYVYPAAPVRPHPLEAGQAVNDGPASDILMLLKTWNWRRPQLDPHLMMGWIGAAMVGGALDWRPLVWITGDKATGKSTLQKLVKLTIGQSALVSSVDASAAGIRQAVGPMSLPVALDELEADEDNRKAGDVIKLARYACSGGQSLRGGADHKGSAFTLMNCFLFSSILIPPMLSQDVSRMAILQLDTLVDALPPALEPDALSRRGAALRRRLIDMWPHFPKFLETYRIALAEVGHTGRSADQFGTLMAIHDLMLYDDVQGPEAIKYICEGMRYSGLTETEDDVADWERCIAHLLTSKIEVYRNGGQRSVGSYIMEASGKHPSENDIAGANKVLGSYGLRVKDVDRGGIRIKMVQIANAHQGLNSLFKDSHWHGKSGTSGVWVQSLRRVPNAMPGDKPTSFDGVMTRFTQIPVANVVFEEDDRQAGGEFCARP